MDRRTTSLGIELKELRDKQGLKIKQLANMANVSRGYISQIELGKKKPGVRTLQKIAGVLEINSNVLLKHISLLKMDFTKVETVSEEKRDPLADLGLSPDDRKEVANFINYLKFKREVQRLAQGQGSLVPPRAAEG